MMQLNKNLFLNCMLLFAVIFFVAAAPKKGKTKKKATVQATALPVVAPSPAPVVVPAAEPDSYPPDFISEEELTRSELGFAPGYTEPMFDQDIPTRECPPNFSWAALGSYLGGMAQPETVEQIRCLVDKYDVGMIVSLTSDCLGSRGERIIKELGDDKVVKLGEHSNISTLLNPKLISLLIPVPDATPPTVEQIKKFFEVVYAMHKLGKRVVVHCTAGKGRTGTFLAAWLAANDEGLAVEARSTDKNGQPVPSIGAVAYLRSLRAGSVEERNQHNFLKDNRLNFSSWLRIVKEEYPLRKMLDSFGDIRGENLDGRLQNLNAMFKNSLIRTPNIVSRVLLNDGTSEDYQWLLYYLVLKNPTEFGSWEVLLKITTKILQKINGGTSPYIPLVNLSAALLRSNITENKYTAAVMQLFHSKIRLPNFIQRFRSDKQKKLLKEL